ncbi:MAG: cell wall hydrolase [Devosia sp.]
MGLVGPINFWARPRHSLAGVIASLVLSLVAYSLLTGGALSPSHGITSASASESSATLTRNGDDLIITGSVDNLFKTGFFIGPNRAEKVNRARLTPDGVSVSGGFDAIRIRIAEMRAPKIPGGAAMPPVLPTIEVASIDPATSDALGAIDQIVPMPGTVMPVSAPASLAYARETAPATTFDLLVDKAGTQVSEKELWCMATAIYFESRGEIYRGQVAVGQVVMNRLAHKIYPKTICGVVFQNQHMRNACQFSFACDGIPETVNEPKAWAQAEEIAKGVINGSLYLTDVGKATHYHATYVYPNWAPRLKKTAKIGHHIFYKFKRA